MNKWVLDASVAAKWFLPPEDETLVEEALGILSSFGLGQCRLIVPDLFWCEVTNILWKASRQGRITRKIAEEATGTLVGLNLETKPSREIATDAIRISPGCERPVYDSMYVALAVMSGCPLLTADERLVNALGQRFPVRWLGGTEAG